MPARHANGVCDANRFDEPTFDWECPDCRKERGLYNARELKESIDASVKRELGQAKRTAEVQGRLDAIMAGPSLCSADECGGHCGYGHLDGCAAIKEFLQEMSMLTNHELGVEPSGHVPFRRCLDCGRAYESWMISDNDCYCRTFPGHGAG